MDIGFHYGLEKEERDGKEVQKIVLYYKQEDFDCLAGLLCKELINDEEFDKRVKIAVDQSLYRLFKAEPGLPRDNAESWLEFYKSIDEVPEEIRAKRISVVQTAMPDDDDEENVPYTPARIGDANVMYR